MQNISILLVEDDSSLIEQLKEYFEIFFNTVYIANNAEEGYKKYKQLCPDIIFTDINMPGMNGLELIKKIRETDNEIEIAILSAHTNTEYFLEAIKLNLVGYLVKPIKSDDIKKIIFDIKKKIQQKSLIYLTNCYKWDKNTDTLYLHGQKVELTSYEVLFIQRLLKNPNHPISAEDIHNYIYTEDEYSQNAITSLVKRLRKKIPKDIIVSCYKEGYKIVI